MEKGSLSKKLIRLILIITITLSVATILFGYITYKQSMEEQYIERGENLAKTVAAYVDGDRIADYLETGETDEAYEDTLAFMRFLKKWNNIEYLYIVSPEEEGTYYVYDSDESDERLELGDFEYWYDDFIESSKGFLNGEEIAPIISNESFGWLLSVYAPIYGSNGNVCGYVGADFSMEEVVNNRYQFLLSLMIITIAITVVFSLFYIYVVRKTIITPINAMAKAADEFLIERTDIGELTEINATSLSMLSIHTGDEIESLSDSMKSMEKKINEYILNLNVVTKKAETDVLTHLFNREAFTQRVSIFLRGCKNYENEIHVFMMIDVDYFKEVNDTYGHVVGDEVLMECATALKRVFRSSDYVARIGGDEFAVFCKNAGNMASIQAKAQQICDRWREISIKGEGKRCMSASIGISLAPKDGLIYHDLYLRADEALYKAKQNGRNQYVIYEDEYK